MHKIERPANFVPDLLRILPANPEPVGDIVIHRHMGPDRVGLKHHRKPAHFGRHIHTLGGCIDALAADTDHARGRPSRPAMARSVVVLPHPEGPSSVNCSPARTWKLTPATTVTLP